jgi:hypothetical protein
MVTAVTLLFLVFVIFIFWIANLSDTKQVPPATDGKFVPAESAA